MSETANQKHMRAYQTSHCIAPGTALKPVSLPCTGTAATWCGSRCCSHRECSASPGMFPPYAERAEFMVKSRREVLTCLAPTATSGRRQPHMHLLQQAHWQVDSTYRLPFQHTPVLWGRSNQASQYINTGLCRVQAGTCRMRCITPMAATTRQSAPAAGARSTWRSRAAARTRAAAAAGPGTHPSAHARPRRAASGTPGPARQPRAGLCQPCILSPPPEHAPNTGAVTPIAHPCKPATSAVLSVRPWSVLERPCAGWASRHRAGLTRSGPRGCAPCPCRCAPHAP